MKFPEVKAAVTEYLVNRDDECTTMQVLIELASKLDVNIAPDPPYRAYADPAGATLASQVSRALNQLSTDGFLVKRIITTHGRRKEAAYRTARATAARNAEAQQRADEDTASLARYAAVRDSLRAAGYEPGLTLSGDITLSLEDWEKLAQLIREHRWT